MLTNPLRGKTGKRVGQFYESRDLYEYIAKQTGGGVSSGHLRCFRKDIKANS